MRFHLSFVLPLLLSVVMCDTTTLAEDSSEWLPGDADMRKLLGERAVMQFVWPDQVGPDEPQDHQIAAETVSRGDKPGDFARISNVTRPTITVCPPADGSQPAGLRPAVIVFPGGGYHILAAEHEGTEVVQWLNKNGVVGIILKYRVPRRGGEFAKHHHALQDAQRAIGIVRSRAKEWNIDPNRIGVLGFSAGGHLAAMLSNHHQKRSYARVDESDDASCRPDFAALIYPAYLTEPMESDTPAADVAMDELSPKKTPPTFIAVAAEDRFTRGSLVYYAALHKAKVPAELHVYGSGGHGTGLRVKPLSDWPRACAEWMQSLQVRGANK